MDKLPHKTRVLDIAHISDNVFRIRLMQPKGYRYQAGQYIHLQYKELPLRPYSLASSPSRDDHLELHVKHDPHGQVSHALCTGLAIDQELKISDAMGENIYQDHEGTMICVAGGIGIVPVKALIQEALHNNRDTNIHLVWGVNSDTDLYLNNLFTELSEAHNNFHYEVIIGQMVTEALMRFSMNDLKQAVKLHLCGPPPMIEACQALFLEKGLDQSHILYDPYKVKP